MRHSVYLKHLVVEDIHFHACTYHRQMRPLDDMTFYSRWLAYMSHMMFQHLPERAMYDDYFSHSVPDEIRGVLAPSD